MQLILPSMHRVLIQQWQHWIVHSSQYLNLFQDRPLGACDRISEMEEATNDTLEDWFMGKKTSTFEHGLSSRRRRLPSPPRDQHVDESGTEYSRQFQEEESATCAQVCAIQLLSFTS